ncbi:MAG: hypothetical protein IJ586_00235, partial [Alloprevotella sp.]|nr:hypothetical protein [Alloprevotella sp.]
MGQMIDNESVDALREQGKRMAGLISKDGPTEQVVSAEVVRVDDDGTVWVSVGGQEAPVDAGMAAKVGDKVSVRLANGTATLTDNKTRPATDDATALIAMGEAGAAHAVALDAQDVAEMAAEVARAIGQHFWTDEAGVHVSNEERDPEGSRNSIFNSLGLIFREGANYLMGLVSGSVVGGSSSDRGMAIFDGLGNAASNVVAWFGRNGIRIGKASAQHVEITANGIEITNGSTQGTVNGVDVAQTASDASDAKTASAQAKQIAEGAASTANTANQTANAASNTASAASTTANNAASAASEAQALVKASYGTSSTAASTQTKAVTCSGFSLFAGALVTVRFSTASTYSGLVKLNVNSTGAKDVWVANAATSASNLLLWGAGASITFRYDGTQYQVVGDPRSWYGKCSIAAGTAAKTDDAQAATGAVICKGATVSLGMAYSNTATSPTLNVAGTGAKALYAGNGTTRPTTANGFGWQDGSTVDLVFDGQYWRVGDTAALANAKAAQDDATSALTQANATKENFWADSSGVHVSTQSNTAAGTYNSLFTSAGLLFRNAANTLVSLTKSALNFYDGDGNNAANITASFGKDEVRVGKVGSGNKNVY